MATPDQTIHVFLNDGDAAHRDAVVTRTYHYDDNGNRDLETDRNGRHYAFAYDANDRLIDAQWLDAPGTFMKDLHYRYDTAGRLVWADSDYRQTSLETTHDYKLVYDALGRVTRYREAVANEGTASESAALTVDQAYAADVLKTQTGTLAGNASATYTNTYGFDALGHLTSVFQNGAGAAGKRVSFGVNPIGDVTLVTRLRNADVNNPGAGSPVASRTYQYDKPGALMTIAYAGAGATTPPEYSIGRDQKHRVATPTVDGGATRSYAYDFDDQLKSQPGQSLAYDANHNRVDAGVADPVGKDNRLREDATYTYAYDAEGNLTKRTAATADAPDAMTDPGSPTPRAGPVPCS